MEGAQYECVGRNYYREMIMMIEQNSNYAYKVIFVNEKGVRGTKALEEAEELGRAISPS